jgi:hypothetical protein
MEQNGATNFAWVALAMTSSYRPTTLQIPPSSFFLIAAIATCISSSSFTYPSHHFLHCHPQQHLIALHRAFQQGLSFYEHG